MSTHNNKVLALACYKFDVDPAHTDAMEHRLLDLLAAVPGVDSAHLHHRADNGHNKWLTVCVSFSPDEFVFNDLETVIQHVHVAMNKWFVQYEASGVCWWGSTSTVDELLKNQKETHDAHR